MSAKKPQTQSMLMSAKQARYNELRAKDPDLEPNQFIERLGVARQTISKWGAEYKEEEERG